MHHPHEGRDRLHGRFHGRGERHERRFAHDDRAPEVAPGQGHDDRDHARGHGHGSGRNHDQGHGPDRGAGRAHGHDRSGPGRGGRRSARVFDHGELRLVVLALIAERPRHGYEIIKAIEDRLAGSYAPSPGVIYPTLTLLEEIGQASMTERDGRKLYAATAEGEAALAANRPAVDAVLARMAAVSAAHGDSPAPQIVRAVENLKLALRLRQGRGPLTEAQLRTVAEALDAAALAVERA